MFRITNIEAINDNYSRKLGNQVIIKVSDYVKNNISKEYVFIRYMGPKFVIVFSGVDTDSVTSFIDDLKHEMEKMKISLKSEHENFEEVEIEGAKKNKKKPKAEERAEVSPKLNFVVTTYYKGTGMEEVLKKLEQYIDNAGKSENEITCI